MNKAVFLDRDGVLNRSLVIEGKPYAPRREEDFILSPDLPKLSVLRDLGYKLIVVTNQPDIANGLVTRAFVDGLHQRLAAAFSFDEILLCPHDSRDQCECRKPKPGMMLAAKQKYNINLVKSFMVGDRWRDVLAGQNAGCKTVFIDYDYKEDASNVQPDFVCHSLAEAIEIIRIQTIE